MSVGYEYISLFSVSLSTKSDKWLLLTRMQVKGDPEKYIQSGFRAFQSNEPVRVDNNFKTVL